MHFSYRIQHQDLTRLATAGSPSTAWNSSLTYFLNSPPQVSGPTTKAVIESDLQLPKACSGRQRVLPLKQRPRRPSTLRARGGVCEGDAAEPTSLKASGKPCTRRPRSMHSPRMTHTRSLCQLHANSVTQSSRLTFRRYKGGAGLSYAQKASPHPDLHHRQHCSSPSVSPSAVWAACAPRALKPLSTPALIATKYDQVQGLATKSFNLIHFITLVARIRKWVIVPGIRSDSAQSILIILSSFIHFS